VNIRLLFALLVFSAGNTLFSAEMKEYEISPRTGSVIDQQEREYFRLFPGIDNFVSATFYEDGYNQVSAVVEYDSAGKRQSVTFAFNETLKKNVNTLINNYEYIYNGNIFNSSLGVKYDSALRQCIMPAKRYDFDNAEEFKFTNMQGKKIKCQVLYADSNVFVICPPDFKYDWRTAANNCVVYHCTEIKEFIGNKDVYQLNLQWLREKSPFCSNNGKMQIPPPPEIAGLIKKTDFTSRLTPGVNTKSLHDILEEEDKKFHISFTYLPGLFTQMNNTLGFTKLSSYNPKDSTWKVRKSKLGSLDFSTMEKNIPGLSFSVDISEHFKLGTMLFYIPTDSIHSNTTDYTSQGVLTSLFLNYSPRLHNIYSRSLWDHIEFSYSLGFLLGFTQNKFQPYYGDNYIYTFSKSHCLTYSHIIVGAFLSMMPEYYFSNKVSVYTELFANMAYSYESEDNNKKAGTASYVMIEPTTVNLSGFGIRFGLCLHY